MLSSIFMIKADSSRPRIIMPGPDWPIMIPHAIKTNQNLKQNFETTIKMITNAGAPAGGNKKSQDGSFNWSLTPFYVHHTFNTCKKIVRALTMCSWPLWFVNLQYTAIFRTDGKQTPFRIWLSWILWAKTFRNSKILRKVVIFFYYW